MDYGIHSEAAELTLANQMEEAMSGNNTASLDQAASIEQAGRPPEAPESTDTTDTIELGSNERLQAIVNLQNTRARVLEESTASFEQVIWGSTHSPARPHGCYWSDGTRVTFEGLPT